MSNKVERAIIMAAGFGNRMRPLTYETPKPLIKVNGVSMIESVIKALLINKIHEIYIVVGYLEQKFAFLQQKYSGIVLINNPYYQNCNNVSSLYVARDHLKNVIILDGDQLISNPSVLNPEFDQSGYNCVWVPGKTHEWLLKVENGQIVDCNRDGGKRGWRLYSISRWTAVDGAKLKHHLEEEFINHKNKQIYWDDVAMFCYPEKYQLGIRKMDPNDVIEIDSLDELVAADSTYSKLLKQEKAKNEIKEEISGL
ncbi:sugar phosphate nucleotidyltransferase [Liquorilactobacillus nagelii]|uniref:sugar phosphate nucleotidyltransferase n=1 Tax=Liquorilactobacillus nagelii TaxID=82688 RepID=UPI0039E7ACAA